MRHWLVGFSERRIIVILLVVTLLKGLLWSTVIPLWQAPDEPAHFATVQFIAEQGRLPGPADHYMSDEIRLAMDAMDADSLVHHNDTRQEFSDTLVGPNEGYILSISPEERVSYKEKARGWANHLPPLYYLLGALIYRVFEGSDLLTRVSVVRYVSVVLTMAAVWASSRVTHMLWPGDPCMHITIPILVGFQPMFTFMGSVVNTDVLLVLIYTLVIYLGLRVMKEGLNAGLAVSMGLALGSGMLTKPIILGILPAVAIALLWDLWQRRRQWRAIVGWWSLIGLAAALVCGWWLIRSTMLTGSPFYGDAMEQYGLEPHPLPNLSLLDYLQRYSAGSLTWLFVTYWAVFGWLDTVLQPAQIECLLAIVALTFAGLTWTGGRALLRRCWQAFDVVMTCYVLMAAWALLPLYGIYDYVFLKANGIDRGLQGRYFLGPLSVQMALLAVGLLTLVPVRWRAAGHWTLRATMMAFSLFCLIAVVIPRYYL